MIPIFFLIAAASLAPFRARAQTLESIINNITQQILNPLVVLLFSLATVIFVWGIIQYVLASAGNPQQAETAKRTILWGIIGMFIMASSWGIVRLLCDFFKVGVGQCL
jgi:NADH:ubiquinone oxidoreductase subunit 2 (subunit N)